MLGTGLPSLWQSKKDREGRQNSVEKEVGLKADLRKTPTRQALEEGRMETLIGSVGRFSAVTESPVRSGLNIIHKLIFVYTTGGRP